MKRFASSPRRGWEEIVTGQGLVYHHGIAGNLYWDESAYYAFTAGEIEVIEAATNELQRLCLAAGERIIAENLFARMGIPEFCIPAIRQTWEREPPSLYGRVDLAYDGHGPPKLLEYNADTPTALLESSIIQWYWLGDVNEGADQFNSIHERMVAKFKELRPHLPGGLLHAACHAEPGSETEDLMTVTYVQETAQQAGVNTRFLTVGEIMWNLRERYFADPQEQRIHSIFKLYPWEWMVHEPFGPLCLQSLEDTHWIEPPWKMMWSNKAILAVLWEMFPNHRNLLPAYLEPGHLEDFVRKPLLSREGANVTLRAGGREAGTEGPYGEEGYVYQQIAPLFSDQGRYAVLGSWLIDGEAAGIGIRESDGPITDNTSRFVPHLID